MDLYNETLVIANQLVKHYNQTVNIWEQRVFQFYLYIFNSNHDKL